MENFQMSKFNETEVQREGSLILAVPKQGWVL